MTSVFDGLSDIFTDTLGEPVVYTPQGGQPTTINMIVIEGTQLSAFDHADVTSHVVQGHARAADVPQIAQGDYVDIGARHLKVAEPIDTDGKGMTHFTLARR